MERLNALEWRTALSLASVVGLRMFGLFLLLPVFALAARDLPGATPLLIGLALGVYGIGQALCQVPLGWLSDRIGRKPAITLGLLAFALGSVVAAQADSIHGIILGRALQGAGAVAGAGLALAADLTRPDQRGKVMGLIGVSIGGAFLLALVLGPPLFALGGLAGLFGLMTGLALGSLFLLWTVVPPAPRLQAAPGPRGALRLVLADPALRAMQIAVFVLHAALTASFVGLPLLLLDDIGLAVGEHWKLYLPVLLASALAMGALLSRGGARAPLRLILAVVPVLGAALALFALAGRDLWLLGAVAFVFFTAFNLLEASLPTLTSRLAPAELRGTALGAYSTAQFLGAFAGGVLGGWALGEFGRDGMFVLMALVVLASWPLLARLNGPAAAVEEGA
ncbi:MFS transporter [Rehaibacterium terrae]|uniref:MFS family permease n=1 Tax=Rehaibacterium terrae TaxID=1341696 RepID=A0A7W7Y0S1_9GAMM|nr:MFS transporter [Rehaibacterium terrae]MBB5015967.1 MFS family permease [Rehaibacterium terrae]